MPSAARPRQRLPEHRGGVALAAAGGAYVVADVAAHVEQEVVELVADREPAEVVLRRRSTTASCTARATPGAASRPRRRPSRPRRRPRTRPGPCQPGALCSIQAAVWLNSTPSATNSSIASRKDSRTDVVGRTSSGMAPSCQTAPPPGSTRYRVVGARPRGEGCRHVPHARSPPYPAPHGKTARRLEWAFLPATPAGLRSSAGAAPRSCTAISQTSGFTPGFASVLVCEDGSRHFVKAASVKAQRVFADSYREEARKLAALPAARPGAAPAVAPRRRLGGARHRVRRRPRAAPAVAGRRPRRAPRLTGAGGRRAHPAPGRARPRHRRGRLRPAARRLAGASARRRTDLDAGHLAEAEALARRYAEVVGGDTLVHTDIRSDNVLIDPDGRALICDWNWPVRGAAWFDSFAALIGPRGEGIDVDRVIAARRLLRDVDPESFDINLALYVGYFFTQCELPVPPTSPHLRDHQRWQGEVCWDWLSRATGLVVTAPRAVGVRLPYADVPAAVRDWVEQTLGSPVVADRRAGGRHVARLRHPADLRRRDPRLRQGRGRRAQPRHPGLFRREIGVLEQPRRARAVGAAAGVVRRRRLGGPADRGRRGAPPRLRATPPSWRRSSTGPTGSPRSCRSARSRRRWTWSTSGSVFGSGPTPSPRWPKPRPRRPCRPGCGRTRTAGPACSVTTLTGRCRTSPTGTSASTTCCGARTATIVFVDWGMAARGPAWADPLLARLERVDEPWFDASIASSPALAAAGDDVVTAFLAGFGAHLAVRSVVARRRQPADAQRVPDPGVAAHAGAPSRRRTGPRA